MTGYSNLAMPGHEQRAALAQLLADAAAGQLRMPYETVSLDELAKAWLQLGESVHRKLLIDLTGDAVG